MRRLGLFLSLLVGATAPVAAQQMWQPEIGIRAGWTRFDDPNSSTNYDLIDLPITGGFTVAPSPGSLYGIIPLHGRLALRPTFALNSFSISFGPVITSIATGVRLDVEITPRFYAGVGANMYTQKQDGDEDTQGALELAAGYRRPFGGGRLRGSAEAFYEKREKSEGLPKLSSYGVRLGFGYAVGGSGTGSRRGAGRPMGGNEGAMWPRSIALQGGWTLASFPGGNGDHLSFSLPFVGQEFEGGAFLAPGPNALSMIFPIAERWALEPSFDLHRITSTGSDPFTAYQVGARMDYAFNSAAYGAFGAEYGGLAGNGVNDGSRVGGVVAAGFRYHLTPHLLGRTELAYRVFNANDALPPGQATSFVFGLMLPLE